MKTTLRSSRQHASVLEQDQVPALLDTLVHRVRLLTAQQVRRAFFPTVSQRGVDARLMRLAERGQITLIDSNSHPELELTAPLASWQPGLELPAALRVSRLCLNRWSLPVQAVRLVIATESAGNELGGCGGRAPRQSEVTHDCHLAAVYLLMRDELPTRARTWRSEAQLARAGWGRGDRLPDALVRDGLSSTAIEFGGAYSEPKLKEFFSFCSRLKLAFEIW